MAKVMEIIAKETNGKSYNTEKYSFDSIGVPSFDYDDATDRVMKWRETAETEAPKRAVPLIDIVNDMLILDIQHVDALIDVHFVQFQNWNLIIATILELRTNSRLRPSVLASNVIFYCLTTIF